MSTILMVAGTAVQMFSSISESQSMARAEKANAEMSLMNAAAVNKASEYEVQKLKRAKGQTLSLQRAMYAKSGVLITEGSPLEVMADTATQFEMDIQAERYNAAVESAKYQYESKYRSGLASSYRSQGYYGAGATLLSGLGQYSLLSGLSKVKK